MSENPWALQPQLEQCERDAIAKALSVFSTRRMAARFLGISIRQLYYKIIKYDLRPGRE